MGTYHFMGVGLAVGAVTCAVDYIEKALDLAPNDQEIAQLFNSSGGVSHDEHERGKIEAIVLFTSREVIEKEIRAFNYIGCKDPGMMHDELLLNLKKVWRRSGSKKGKKVFWCEVDIDNFQDCFDKIVKVAYRFSAHGKQGKEIWCNLTGGANSINLALLSMARWTGLATKHYVISQHRKYDYQKEVSVPQGVEIMPNKDGYFNVVPFFMTRLDTLIFYEILLEIEAIDKPIKSDHLLNRLKGKPQFNPLKLDDFKRHYMLKLYGLGYTSYDMETDSTRITDVGVGFINELKDLETVIEAENMLSQKNIDMVEESKKWDWFKQVDISD